MNVLDENNEEEIETVRVSKILKKEINYFAEQTGIGRSAIWRMGAFRIIEEFKELEESLKTIDKSISDFCPVYDKRCMNFAFVNIKKMLRELPSQDRIEIEIAIERQKKKLLKNKSEEFDELAKST